MQSSLRIDHSTQGRPFSLLLSRTYVWLALKFGGQIALQREHVFLWLPVFFSFGIGAYFTFSFEPPLILAFVMFLVWLSIHVLFVQRLQNFYVFSSFALLLVLAGFSAATLRTSFVNAPMLVKAVGPVDIIGDVKSIEHMEAGRGVRIILSSLEIEKLEAEVTPRYVRLRLRAHGGIKVGQRIKALAILNPPSPPVVPGGFDFRQYMFFKGIGAVGFIYRLPEVLEHAPKRLWDIESLRHKIAARLAGVMPLRDAGIAMALMVGQKGAISAEDAQAIRDAGLAHMLAISGLHVGLLSGVLFFIFRFLLALNTRFALIYPIKKIAAVMALSGAVLYMLLAGATIPTQRAVLTISIVFLAVILDRSPISLRLVAFSALVVLVFRPESLLTASFQMSFAAVSCLIYFYDVTRGFWAHHYAHSNWFRKAILYFVGVCMTTVIASIATAPFSLYHFGQVSFLGSFANLVAVPLLAFLIMPFALISLVLMPFGCDYWALYIVSFGIDAMLEIAYWAANLPNAVVRGAAWTNISFVLLVISGLWLIMWKGVGKVLAIPVILVSLVLAYTSVQPDVLISGNHKLAGFKDDESGALYVSSMRREKFARGNWEEFFGLKLDSAQSLPYKGGNRGADLRDFYTCGASGCHFVINGHNVSYVTSPYEVARDCKWADILISVAPVRDNLRRRCDSEIIIGKFNTWRSGAHAVFIGDDGVRVVNAADKSSNRPWSVYQAE